jgi:hypothetical protein
MLDAPLSAQFEFWLYRAGAYVVLHVLDEPAWLALIFC